MKFLIALEKLNLHIKMVVFNHDSFINTMLKILAPFYILRKNGNKIMIAEHVYTLS